MTEPIPGPPGLPIIGNINDIDPIDTIKSLTRLADIYGPVFKLHLGGIDRVFVSSQAILNELCDEKRFTKVVAGPLKEIRHGVEDGLFTAHPGEHNWEIAHRVLMPAFGPLSIRNMFDEMHDIASQLVVKWARFGPREKIDVTADFTRLTLDSIALCAMDMRFNSFYHEDMHPFVNAMTGFLQESGSRASRPQFVNYFMRSSQQKFDSDIALLKQVATEVVAERKAKPSDKKDLLNAMLNGRDPKTGEGLTYESILNNMITFLIAGHETTSGMLSFLFYRLLKNPSAYQKAQKQVDDIVGRGPVTVEHMSKLPYIEACLRETLRLTPTAPAFSLQARPDTAEEPILIAGGKYEIKRGQPLVALLPKVHRDPLVFGEDAEAFRPERMLDEPFSKLPPNSWKPFGNGMRGCIGRPFAWQESILTVAMLLQNFNFRFDDPSYVLGIKQTLTIKPKDFYMYANLRDHIDPVYLERSLYVSMPKEEYHGKIQKVRGAATNGIVKKLMTILYGSNAGTCEALAQSLARVASGRGYKVEVDPLDSAVDKLPNNQPIIMIMASYEGQPPDNAAHFVEWLENLGGGKRLEGVRYAVFGCGNHDWVNTFHRIPKLIDSALKKNGACRITETGLVDVAAGDVFNDFDSWQDEHLWSELGIDADIIEDSSLEIEIDTDSRRSNLRQDVKEAVVLSNELLTAEGVSEKRHVTLRLPSGMTYKVGDYLAVLPVNHPKTIRRVLKHYGLPWDALITIKPGANTTLPTGHPLSAMDVLGAYVELTQPATRKNVAKIAASISDEPILAHAQALAGPQFDTDVSAKRLSPLDLLEKFPEAALPLADFLAMLPPMRIRQYSISSSPLADPTIATLTCSVLDSPHKAKHEERFLGVASNYLASVEEHDRIHVAVKPSHGAFHPPSDIENTPIIMFCAGSGLAPFRGFLQERAKQIEGGRKLAPAYLFIGCKHPGKDKLFKEELEEWEKNSVVKLFYAFSQATEQSKNCRYVQDRLWNERDEMVKVFNDGAKLYVCGSADVGEGVTNTTKKIYQEAAEALGKPKSNEQVDEWFNTIKGERFASDVFS